MPHALRVPVSLALIALVLSACGAARPPAAVVAGERITDQQLAQDEVFFTFLASLNRQSCGTPISGETQRSACARYTLATVIQEDLVKHYAAANGITVPRSEVASAIAQLESGLGGAGALDQRREASGMTRADLNELASRLLLFGEVRRALGERNVTDAQLRQLYRRLNLTQPFSQVRDKLVQQLAAQAFAVWLRGRLASADISVNPKYGRLDTSTGEIVPIRSTTTGSRSPTPSPTPLASPSP